MLYLLYLLYLGLMVFCLLSGLLEKLEKTDQMLRARREQAHRQLLYTKLATVQVSLLDVSPFMCCESPMLII